MHLSQEGLFKGFNSSHAMFVPFVRLGFILTSEIIVFNNMT